MSQKNFVELRNVTKRFGSNMVIDNINLTIPQGQMVTLLGPSGCGKTTILRLVAGLEKPSRANFYRWRRCHASFHSATRYLHGVSVIRSVPTYVAGRKRWLWAENAWRVA